MIFNMKKLKKQTDVLLLFFLFLVGNDDDDDDDDDNDYGDGNGYNDNFQDKKTLEQNWSSSACF